MSPRRARDTCWRSSGYPEHRAWEWKPARPAAGVEIRRVPNRGVVQGETGPVSTGLCRFRAVPGQPATPDGPSTHPYRWKRAVQCLGRIRRKRPLRSGERHRASRRYRNTPRQLTLQMRVLLRDFWHEPHPSAHRCGYTRPHAGPTGSAPFRVAPRDAPRSDRQSPSMRRFVPAVAQTCPLPPFPQRRSKSRVRHRGQYDWSRANRNGNPPGWFPEGIPGIVRA